MRNKKGEPFVRSGMERVPERNKRGTGTLFRKSFRNKKGTGTLLEIAAEQKGNGNAKYRSFQNPALEI